MVRVELLLLLFFCRVCPGGAFGRHLTLTTFCLSLLRTSLHLPSPFRTALRVVGVPRHSSHVHRPGGGHRRDCQSLRVREHSRLSHLNYLAGALYSSGSETHAQTQRGGLWWQEARGRAALRSHPRQHTQEMGYRCTVRTTTPLALASCMKNTAAAGGGVTCGSRRSRLRCPTACSPGRRWSETDRRCSPSCCWSVARGGDGDE